ncbi:hypothetical protein BTO04_10675 [Polaribacter sp. SA4-10]|uniref:hypothetical protein n=1 Tax=Polaribacter sp. SA4-10 TaxID=754397 RepID=UPI000B3C3F3E|nr:hypothetical protein [Polaribacter sp. SA4-10]ARV07122.1 hypothetical protein BTO04_10675 [Polaribacter sp. SA4-10]
MKTTQTHTNFTEWLSVEDIHNDSKEWLLELAFLKDEYLFFEDLMKSYTLQLIDLQDYSKNKKIIDTISNYKKENDNLIKLVQEHENKLEILVDGINKPKEEEAYKKGHKGLKVLVKNFLKENKVLKLKLFNIIKKIKKTEKQKRLIDLE